MGFYNPGPNEMSRVQYQAEALRVAGKGSQPSDCSPIFFIAPDIAYRVTVDIELDGDAQAGLLLFYSKRLYCGLGFDARGVIMHRYGWSVVARCRRVCSDACTCRSRTTATS